MGFVAAMANWLYGVVFGPPQPPHVPPPPPQGAAYGYHWQANAEVPATLGIFDPDSALAGGIYVVFTSQNLSTGVDPFGRLGAGPVFDAPAAVSAGLQTLIAGVQGNPPPNEGMLWANVTQQRKLDLDGFLTYVDTCLTLLHGAAPALLAALTGAAYPIFISPATRSNQTFAADIDFAVTALVAALRRFDQGQPIAGAAIDAMVNQQYNATVGTPAPYAQFAADMNAAPLYSLFVAEGAFTPNFLGANFVYNGAPLNGPTLQNWLTAGDALLDDCLRNSPQADDGVLVREAFFLALIYALNPASAVGTGSGSGVKFNVRREGDNDPASASFRPPAVGLAHELMHAMHYAAGTATGAELEEWSTTAAELLFTGIQPYQGAAISENTVRLAWGGVAPDPTNVWPVPARRTIYEAPVGTTAAAMRAQLHTI